MVTYSIFWFVSSSSKQRCEYMYESVNCVSAFEIFCFFLYTWRTTKLCFAETKQKRCVSYEKAEIQYCKCMNKIWESTEQAILNQWGGITSRCWYFFCISWHYGTLWCYCAQMWWTKKFKYKQMKETTQMGST